MSNLPENVQSSHPADDPGSPQGADYHADLHNDVNAMVNGLSELLKANGDHTELTAGSVGTGLVRVDGTRVRRRVLDVENPPSLLSLGSLMVYHGLRTTGDSNTRTVADAPAWTRIGDPSEARFPINQDGGLLVHAQGALELRYTQEAGADVRCVLRYSLSGAPWETIGGVEDRWANRADIGRTIRNTLRPSGWFWVPAGTDNYQVELAVGVATVQGSAGDRQYHRYSIQLMELSE